MSANGTVEFASNTTTSVTVQSLQQDIKAICQEQVQKLQAAAASALNKQVKETIVKHMKENPNGDIKKLVKDELAKFKKTTAKALVAKAKGVIKRLARQTLPKLKRQLHAKYVKLKAEAIKAIRERYCRFKRGTVNRLKRHAKRLLERAKAVFRRHFIGPQGYRPEKPFSRLQSVKHALIHLRITKLWVLMYDIDRPAAMRARHSVRATVTLGGQRFVRESPKDCDSKVTSDHGHGQLIPIVPLVTHASTVSQSTAPRSRPTSTEPLAPLVVTPMSATSITHRSASLTRSSFETSASSANEAPASDMPAAATPRPSSEADLMAPTPNVPAVA